MNNSRNVQVINNLYKAYEAGDLESFYKDLSPELV